MNPGWNGGSAIILSKVWLSFYVNYFMVKLQSFDSLYNTGSLQSFIISFNPLFHDKIPLFLCSSLMGSLLYTWHQYKPPLYLLNDTACFICCLIFKLTFNSLNWNLIKFEFLNEFEGFKFQSFRIRVIFNYYISCFSVSKNSNIINTYVSNLMYFQEEMVYIFLTNETRRSKSVKI